ncbi:MAG: DUF3467 domain-containing protein [Hyphomicrobiales bacterium]
MSDKAKNNKLDIEISEELADGVYSNLAVITHSPSEFILDFVQMMPGVPKAKVKSRVILTPEHAKRLHRALSENLAKFEAQNGPIREDKQENMIPPFNLGPTPEA